MDMISLHDGRILQVHEFGQCASEHCCVHRPSEHPLNAAPLAWVPALRAMFRVCVHDQPHPDPDDLEFKARNLDFMTVEVISSVHLDHCDGCCQPRESKEESR